ncbi:MAG: hypothetical protein ACETWG_01410 [Candidatus Neomarinimicrobiota bacterium]
MALFSAEQMSHRRILIDGVGNRRVQVELDSLGQAVVNVWGVDEQTYVGRRAYEKGYLIPVTIRVDFPRKNLMSIKVAGTHFRDFVRYKVVDSDIYVIDLYPQALPRESYFREETISALWPNGRFQPDITPASPPADLTAPAELRQINVRYTLAKEMAPYRRVVRRAVIWAGSVSGLLLITGLPLIWFLQRRKAALGDSKTHQPTRPAGGGQPTISDAKVRAIMALNGSLSYDEASLLANMGGEKSLAGPRKTP